jgi:CRISPR system Cascade subunit CasD
MTEYLVFQIYGPMVSFGDTAVGEFRPSLDHPSRSMILGLVAGALGIEREHEEKLSELDESLYVATLSINSGILLRDYHTAQVPTSVSVKRQPAATRQQELDRNDLQTILSSRDYLQDALYRVVLWNREGVSNLTEIEKALRNPVFVPYLGRKSCPTALPFDPQSTKGNGIVAALRNYQSRFEEELSFLIPKKGSLSLYHDLDERIGTTDGDKIHWRKDRLISRKNWQYGDRREVLKQLEVSDVFQ